MKRTIRGTSARQLSKGFSLVETVLAMAVMGLAVTVLLGLLPHGMEMSRKAGVSAGESRVTTDILAELSQQDWASLAGYDGQTFYFDDQGIRIREGDDELVSYVAQVRMPVPVQLPGSPVNSDDIKRVIINVAATPKRDFSFRDNAVYSTYVTLLPRFN